jgi:hypothetical protein
MYRDVIEEMCLTRERGFHGLRWDRADMPKLRYVAGGKGNYEDLASALVSL